MTPSHAPEAVKVELERLQEARADFVVKRNAMNAAVPAVDATPAERALYDERYKADHEAERALYRAALVFAQVATDNDFASLVTGLSAPAPGAGDDDYCPHCGGHATSIKSNDKVHPYRIICDGCGASSAHHGDYRACSLAWRRRVAVPHAPATRPDLPDVDESISKRWAGVIPLVEQITAEEGATVAFACQNPDFNGLPNEAVTVVRGPDWQEVTYRADTLAECLTAALASHRGGDAG